VVQIETLVSTSCPDQNDGFNKTNIVTTATVNIVEIDKNTLDTTLALDCLTLRIRVVMKNTTVSVAKVTHEIPAAFNLKLEFSA
jgi:hypothetical protein